MIPKHLRYGLVLLGTAAAVGCSSDGDGGTGTGSISLAITPTSATVQQGASQAVTVTLTRLGGFTGTVDIDVTGEPTGVTATASNAQTVGAVTTATITIQVGATVAPALYPLVMHATGAGVSEVTQNFALTVTEAPAPAYVLTLSSSTVSTIQGSATPVTTVNLARINFTGNVALSVENLPTGVTAAFNPASPVSGNSSVLTLTVALNAPTGTFTNLLVRGVAAGLADRTVPLSVTISATPGPSIAVSLSAATLTIAQGASTPTTTVNIARTNFIGDVTLSVLNLPTGVTVSFAPPNPQTGNSSVLTLTVAAAAPTGTFTNLSVRGVSAVGTVSTPLSLIITSAPGGGSGNVTVTFAACAAADRAIWLAFRDGTAGNWTEVTAAADVYQFNITQSKGSFAYVTLANGASRINVQHFTQTEIIANPFSYCGTVTPNTRVANGTVSNLPAGHSSQVSFGGNLASPLADGPFQITGARNGTFDLVGLTRPLAGAGTGRAFVKRGENPAAGGSFSVPVNFTDATLSAAAATAPATLQGLASGEALLGHSMAFFTGGTACVVGGLYGGGSIPPGLSISGIPASLRLGTDVHSISLVFGGTNSFRFLVENLPDVVARAATPFVLPAELPVPVVTDAGGPYKRPSLIVSGVPAELNTSHQWIYEDQGAAKHGVITATQGWVGGTNLALDLPNFSGVGTFNNTWAPATGAQLNWSVGSSGGAFPINCTAGERYVVSSRIGTL